MRHRGNNQREFDTTAEVFNLHCQHADDPLRVEMDRLRAARAREEARAFEAKMQTTLEGCPGFQGVEGLTGPDAVGRLMLDNFAHIKSYWQMVTPKMAQISLRFGADDIDGTVVEEKIYHDAGANTPQGLRRQDLVRLITEAGRIPFERDTLYRAVTRSEESFTVAV